MFRFYSVVSKSFPLSCNFFNFHLISGTFCGVFRRQALDRGAMLLKVDKIVTGWCYCWCTTVGVPLLVYRCWCTTVVVPLLVYRCWCTAVGVPLLVYRCWCTTVGVLLLEYHCWCTAVGVLLLVYHCCCTTVGVLLVC